MKRTILAVAATSLLLASCGGSDDTAKERPATSPMEASEEPAEDVEAEDPYAPNVGDRALSVGETRKGRNVSMQLAEIRYPYPPAEYREPVTAGNAYVGLLLEECLTTVYEEDVFSTGNNDWSVVTPGGQEYGGAGTSYDDFPTPKFPEFVTLTDDRCLKGWIVVEVPEGERIASVVFRPGGETVAEWLPPAKGDGPDA